MEIVPSNSSENEDQPRGNRRCKRKRTSLNESKLASSSSLRSSKTKAAAASGGCLQAPPRAIGDDGHFYECVKCNEVGSLICCDTCACTYHCQCLDPPIQKSIPEGDWFCPNCSEDDNLLSDSTANHKKRRRSLRRACKVVSSGCCFCSNINKTLIPDENDFFSFKTKSTAQSKLSNRGQPSSARNDDGVGSTIIQQNTNNNGDKRLILRKRAETNQIGTRNTGWRRAGSAQAAEKDQNVNLPPRCRGRPPKKRNYKEPGTSSPKPNEQQQQIQKPELAMIINGANLPPEYVEAIKAANEAAQRNASIKEIPWSGVELDALWVGVRRHGPDNWDTILEDPNLYILVLCRKTSPALSWRWQIELEKMHSILKTSGFLLPSPPPTTLTHHEPREHRQEAAISNEGGEGTPQHFLPPPSQIPVTSTQCCPLAPNHHQGSSSSSSFPTAAVIVSNGGEVGGEPVNQTPDPKAILDGQPIAEQVLLPPKISVTSTEFGLLIQNHQGSPSCSVPAAAATVPNGGEAGGESVDQTPETAAILSDREATSQQVLPLLQVPVTSRESAPLVQNHQGSSSSCSVPVVAVIVPNEGEAGGEPVNQTPEPPAILSDEEATAQQVLPQLQISVASTESNSLVPNHHQATSLVLAATITIPNIGEAGGEPINQTPEPPAKSDEEATTQQVQVASTESGLLVQNLQGSSSSTSIIAPVVTVSNGEEGGEPIEANTQQRLLPEIPVASPDFGASGPNKHPGASSSLRDSPLIPAAEVVSNEEAVVGERIEASSTDQKHLSVATSPPESGGALVVVGRNNDQRGSSSSMIQRDCDVTVAIPPPSPPPRWRPNLNLHPMANHMLFEAFQQREDNLEAQMIRNHMVGVVEEAAPGRLASMAAQSPPANNNTTRPDNLFLGGFFPVRNHN